MFDNRREAGYTCRLNTKQVCMAIHLGFMVCSIQVRLLDLELRESYKSEKLTLVSNLTRKPS